MLFLDLRLKSPLLRCSACSRCRCLPGCDLNLRIRARKHQGPGDRGDWSALWTELGALGLTTAAAASEALKDALVASLAEITSMTSGP